MIIFSPRVLTSFSNIDIIIQGLDEIIDRCPFPVKFLFAAYVVTEDGVSSFGNLLNNIRHRDKVYWCGHVTAERDLAAYYQLSDVVVSLYSGYLESSPASIIEAMMCGAIPVVAELPVVRFWVENGKNGFLVKQRNPRDFINKTLVALAMAQNNSGVIHDNHNRALLQANYDTTMKMMEEKYVSVAGMLKPGFQEISEHRALFEKGIILDFFSRKKDACDYYSMAQKISPTKQVNDHLQFCLKENANKKPYIDKNLENLFRNGRSNNKLPPSPSGDMREYVWVAPFRSQKDIPKVHKWLKKLADMFHYDEDYLNAIYFERNDHNLNFVTNYLKTYRPLHVGLSGYYLKIGRNLEIEGDYDSVIVFYETIIDAWSRFDKTFREHLKDKKQDTAEAYYRTAVLKSLHDTCDHHEFKTYLVEACTLDPEHVMAKHLLENPMKPNQLSL